MAAVLNSHRWIFRTHLGWWRGGIGRVIGGRVHVSGHFFDPRIINGWKSAQARPAILVVVVIGRIDSQLPRISSCYLRRMDSLRSTGQRLDDEDQLARLKIGHARTLVEAGERPGDVARSLGVSRSTLGALARRANGESVLAQIGQPPPNAGGKKTTSSPSDSGSSKNTCRPFAVMMRA